MSARPDQILGRFPTHLEARKPGKRLREVVAALAHDLDVLSADLAAIRRSHRLGHADDLADLLRLAALHGLGPRELAIAFLRFDRGRARLDALRTAPVDERDGRAEELCDLWGLAAPRPRLLLFSPEPPPGESPDPAAAADRLLAVAGTTLSYRGLVEAIRARVARVCGIHADGNGTVRALLDGAANALDLDLGPLHHSADRFWHAAFTHDRLRLAGRTDDPLPVADEILGIEENPLRRDATDLIGRSHAERFDVIRRGFDRVLLQVRVVGRAARTVGPMLVNRDEGHGVGFAGTVPPASRLTFTEEGRVRLDDADVTSFAFAWKGACFAGDDLEPAHDFVFDGNDVDPARRAVFAVTSPAGALDRDALFPHAGDSLPMPGLGVGVTRFAFFVQEAHFASHDAATVVRRVTPRTGGGPFDGSVFAPGPGQGREPAADVGLSWVDHEAYAVRLLIPARFRTFDAEGVEVPRRVADAVERFRPAGVAVRVEYADDRWILGSAELATPTADDPIARLRSGTALWSSPPEV